MNWRDIEDQIIKRNMVVIVEAQLMKPHKIIIYILLINVRKLIRK